MSGKKSDDAVSVSPLVPVQLVSSCAPRVHLARDRATPPAATGEREAWPLLSSPARKDGHVSSLYQRSGAKKRRDSHARAEEINFPAAACATSHITRARRVSRR